jgi:hypothetical protein
LNLFCSQAGLEMKWERVGDGLGVEGHMGRISDGKRVHTNGRNETANRSREKLKDKTGGAE